MCGGQGEAENYVGNPLLSDILYRIWLLQTAWSNSLQTAMAVGKKPIL